MTSPFHLATDIGTLATDTAPRRHNGGSFPPVGPIRCTPQPTTPPTISDFAKQDRRQAFRRAVLHVYADWHPEHPPQQINNGWCEEFATAVIDRLDQWGYDAEMVGCEVGGFEPMHKVYGGHVWVYDPMAGRHYDAECPRGVDNFRDLPHCQRKQRQPST